MNKIHVAGVEILIDEPKRYIQADDVCEGNLRELWKIIESCYAGYTVMYCYHNTVVPVELLREIGVTLADDCVEMRISRADLGDLSEKKIVRITQDTFEEFAACHDEHNPEMYWTSERIKEDLSQWDIHAIVNDDEITGYVLMALWNPVEAEIFCVVAADNEQMQALIAAGVKSAFEAGKTEALYMADRNSAEQEAAMSVGFQETGYYVGYKAQA